MLRRLFMNDSWSDDRNDAVHRRDARRHDALGNGNADFTVSRALSCDDI
jgi:hypothetical protein